MKSLRLVGLLSLVVLQGCASGPDTHADEVAIHALVAEWAAAAQAKDPVRFTAMYAEDAVILLEKAPDLQGLEAIRAGIAGMMQDPNFALSFQPEKVVVARAGDQAWEMGSYTMTLSGPDGAPAPDAGRYVVLWRKEADGTWKVVVDAPVSDPM